MKEYGLRVRGKVRLRGKSESIMIAFPVGASDFKPPGLIIVQSYVCIYMSH
jgi:hypothetical protein